MRLQVVHDQAIAFQDGTHHHYHPGAPDPLAAVEASIQATHAGNVLGAVIDQWVSGRAGGLGVNASITVHDETTLTPYIFRAHDQELRDTLQTLTTPDARGQLLLVIGTSCTGKTRSLYEAVRAVLPHWQLVAPGTDTDLARLLTDGVPARTVIWLDELQNKLTKLGDGVTAAKAISALLNAPEVGPFLVAGTIWPHDLQNLTQRPTDSEAATGVAAIPDLLGRAVTIPVPETFTDADVAKAPADPRLTVAIATTAATSSPDQSRKLTQVLAGGTQLLNRLHRDPGSPGAFSLAARAVIHAAGDLRRIGMPNPLPRWALKEASAGYLEGPPPPRRSRWFQAAIAQLAAAAALDDPLTGRRTLDIHAEGVPALTPVWHTDAGGTPIEAYALHDFLLQDHLDRYRYQPTSQQLWDALVSGQMRVHREVADALAMSASCRGLFSVAEHLDPGRAGAAAIREEPLPLARLRDGATIVGNDGLLTVMAGLGETGIVRGRDSRGEYISLVLGHRRTVTISGLTPGTQFGSIAELLSLAEAVSSIQGNEELWMEVLAEARAAKGDYTSLTTLVHSGNRHATARLLWVTGSTGPEHELNVSGMPVRWDRAQPSRDDRS